ncbi:hypothetical protein AB0C76_19210 [Kitasatospora sp. NPDC048722]|uniref:hypothetical protein n=1 Tax=Kitasatospora sp. NPDC048722 TaxID=3155639 RepID=UPI0033E31BB3
MVASDPSMRCTSGERSFTTNDVLAVGSVPEDVRQAVTEVVKVLERAFNEKDGRACRAVRAADVAVERPRPAAGRRLADRRRPGHHRRAPTVEPPADS